MAHAKGTNTMKQSLATAHAVAFSGLVLFTLATGGSGCGGRSDAAATTHESRPHEETRADVASAPSGTSIAERPGSASSTVSPAQTAAEIGAVSDAARPATSKPLAAQSSAGAPAVAEAAVAHLPVPRTPAAGLDSFGHEVPEVSMGRAVAGSALAGMPGYAAPKDPEAASVLEGRRAAGDIKTELSGGEHSPEALAALILETLEKSDRARLMSLYVDRKEFSEICWPEFPESRAVTQIQAADAWEFLSMRNISGVNRAIDDNGGHLYSFEGVTYSLGHTTYTNFTLWQGVEIHARDESGTPVVLKFARSFVERNGSWKIYSSRD